MTMDVRVIMCCIPVRLNPQPDDYSSWERISCPRCGESMWMGDRQKAALEVSPDEFQLLCAFCATMEIKKLQKQYPDLAMDITALTDSDA